MSTTSESVESVEPATAADHADHGGGDHGQAGGHEHPTNARYWAIALILAVVTALEVAVSYIEGLGDAEAPLLLIGMVVKFFMVASFFMHLKFDSRVTRRLFISGLSLALFCYLLVFMMFRQLGPRDDRQQIDLVESGIPVR